jgi:hypothetical protein
MSIKITSQQPLTRRHFIQGTGLTGGLVLGASIHPLLSSCIGQSATTKPSEKTVAVREPNSPFIPDLEINLKAEPKSVSIRSGQSINVWSYTAIGAVLMSVSTVVVSINAMLLRRISFKEE